MDSLYFTKNALWQEQPWGGDIESRWDKKHSMPIVAGIVGAVVEAGAVIGTAVAAGSVVAAGGAMAVAGAAVTLVAAAATVAGLAMTVVGAITGDKSLMQIGGIVGLAGGVAGLAGSAMTASVDGALALSAAPAEASLSAAPVESTAAAAQAAEQAGTSGMAQSAGGFMPATVLESAPSASALALAPPESTLSSAQSAQNAGTSGLAQSAGGFVAPSSVGSSTGVFDSLGNFFGVGKDVATTVGKDAATTVGKDAAFSVKDLIQPAGQVLSGIGQSGQMDAQIDLQNTKLAQEQKQFDAKLGFEQQQYNTQQANANTQGRLNLSALPWTPSNGQLTAAQIAAHDTIDAQGNVIPPKTA